MAKDKLGTDLRSFLFRANPVPMFLYDCRSLRIITANDAAIARYGYSAREFHAMTLAALHPSGESPALQHPLSLDPDLHPGSIWTHATREGKVFPVELRVHFTPRGRRLRLLSARDATPVQQTRLRVIRSERIHRSLVEECPFGIYRFNLETRRYGQANPALLDLLGYTPEEFCSLDQCDLFSDPSERDAYLAELRATGSIRDVDTTLRTREGHALRVSLSGFLCDCPDTGQQCVQVYVRDTTRQHELEEQLSHSHRIEAVGRLAGGIAHDFNNITQSISLSCELALRTPLAPAIQNKLFGILQQATRAAEITQQLLAFSRRQLLQPHIVNLNDCVRNSLPTLTRAVGVDVRIELQLEEAVPPLLIDPDQLSLVLMHLADNARDAMPNGGRLRISTAAAPFVSDSFGQFPAEPCAVLTVADTGIGMDESTRSRIFEPFFSTKDIPSTTGLSLSTVYGIILQSKGRIECDSAPGIGATFRIFLPIAPVHPASNPSAAKDNGFQILLAEDDALVNKHLTRALKDAGFSVCSVCNGEEALAAFIHQSFHIVITDIVMPRITGVELTRRLRQRDPNLPVILISGYSEQVSVLQHLPQNRIAFLQKPFASQTLLALLRNLIFHPSPEQSLGKED